MIALERMEAHMKRQTAILLLGAALAAGPVMAQNKGDEHRAKKYTPEYTPVGAFGVQKAEAHGLKESDKGWVRFIAQCAAAHQQPNPNDKAVAKCYADAEPFSGTPQWVEHFQPCAERVFGKLRGRG